MKAKDVMTHCLVSVAPGEQILQAIARMISHQVSGMPVIDADGRLVGIVTEGDFLRRAETQTEAPRRRWLELLLGPGSRAEEYVSCPRPHRSRRYVDEGHHRRQRDAAGRGGPPHGRKRDQAHSGHRWRASCRNRESRGFDVRPVRLFEHIKERIDQRRRYPPQDSVGAEETDVVSDLVTAHRCQRRNGRTQWNDLRRDESGMHSTCSWKMSRASRVYTDPVNGSSRERSKSVTPQNALESGARERSRAASPPSSRNI